MTINKKEKLVEKLKEGVSVEDIEKMAKNYTTEAFILIAILIAMFSSILGYFTTSSWSLAFAGIGAIVGFFFPVKIESLLKSYFSFVIKQQKPMEITIGVVLLIFAIFIPIVIFAAIGLFAGATISYIKNSATKG